MAATARRFDPKSFLAHVGAGKKVNRYRPNEVVFKQGEPADLVFYLQSGRAKESVASDQGKEAVVGMLEPGFFFGTGSMDGTRSWTSTVTAVTECLVTSITTDAMKAALKEPVFAQLFMVYLLEHTTRIEAEKIDLLFNSTEKRLARRLLILAHVGDGKPEVIGPEITQEMLGEMIGTTRPRVNFFLNRFRSLGLIRYNDETGITVMPGLLRSVLMDSVGEPH